MRIKETLKKITTESNTTKNNLDVQEAYNLWEGLRTRYDAIEKIQIYENFIHDLDFEILSENILYENIEKQINKLENEMNKYKLTLPNRPPKSARTPANTEAIDDRFIAMEIMKFLQSDLDLHIRSIRTSVTSENIRTLFKNFLNETIQLYDNGIKYLKAKGWMGIPPQYPHSPKGTNEKIDSGEAFHFWDHLSSRYDAIGVTQIFINQAHDKDFKYILKKGLKKSLEKQVNILEKEMDHFGLPLPTRPAKSVKTVMNSEPIEDEIIFRDLFTSIQQMLNLHSLGFKQNITNDRIRNIYIKFLKEEIDLFNNLAKYGKAKGWTRPVPMHRAGQQNS